MSHERSEVDDLNAIANAMVDDGNDNYEVPVPESIWRHVQSIRSFFGVTPDHCEDCMIIGTDACSSCSNRRSEKG